MNGNMGQVRAAVPGELYDHVAINSLMAELVAGATPHWYVLEIHPGQGRVAAAHRWRGDFGVFVPETEDVVVSRGRMVRLATPLFTNYIFVFVWDVMRHRDRIEAVPGVAWIMFDVGKPVVISDCKIDEIRAVENSKRPIPEVMLSDMVKKKRHRWRNSRKDKVNVETERSLEIVGVRPWSPFQDSLLSLDSEGRNHTLMHVLGLSS